MDFLATPHMRRIWAAQSRAELLLSSPDLEPDLRERVERSLTALRAVQNAGWLLIVPIDIRALVEEAEWEINAIWWRTPGDAPPLFPKPPNAAPPSTTGILRKTVRLLMSGRLPHESGISVRYSRSY